MEFISQAYKYKHNWWRYVLTYVLSNAASVIVLLCVIAIFFAVCKWIDADADIATAFNPVSENNSLPAYANAFFMLSLHGFLLLSFLLFFKWLHKGNWSCLFNSFSKFRWNRIASAILLYLLVSLVSLPFFCGELEEMKATFAFNAAEFFPYVLVLLIMLPLQVTAEEVINRSYFGQMFALIFKRPIILVVLTSIIFAFAHYGDMQHAESYAVLFTAIGISGLTYAIIMVLDNGIEICIGLHFINNLISFVLLKRDGFSGLFEINPEYQSGWISVITELVYSIVILLVFTKLYHWDWRKLFQKIERPALVADEAQ